MLDDELVKHQLRESISKRHLADSDYQEDRDDLGGELNSAIGEHMSNHRSSTERKFLEELMGKDGDDKKSVAVDGDANTIIAKE